MSELNEAKRVAEQGMSFDIVRRSGLFPPRDVLNAFFACGYDDREDGDVLRWSSFALAEADYEAFIAWWLETHAAARADRLDVEDAEFNQWFTRAADAC